MGLKEILQREKEQYTTSENKNGNFCSFWIQRLYLQHAQLDQFWMTFSWTLLTLRTFYGAVLGLSSYIFLVVSPLPPQCSLTMPYLCKYFGLCCLKGDILKRHQNHGLFFSFLISAVLNSILPLYKNSSGSVTSNAILWVGFFPFKNLYKTGSVCVSMGTHLVGEVHTIVKKGELSCFMCSWCKVLRWNLL